MKIFVNEPIHPAAMELLRSRAEVVSEWEDVPAGIGADNKNWT